MAVHTFVVALAGTVVTALLAHVARRHAVADRLRGDVPGGGRTLPRALRRPLARALHDAALRSTPEQAVEVWFFASGIATIVGFGLAPTIGVLAGVGVLVSGPVGLLTARHRRTRLMMIAVPDTLERVGSELRAGGTVATALTTISHGGGPLASDISRVEARVLLGAGLPDALHAWARERTVVGVEATAGALALCATVGGRAADGLDALATSLRDRIAVTAEARALSAQARYSAWVIGLAPIVYLVGTAVMDPRSIHALTGTAVGRLCAAGGAALEVLGAVWIRAIVSGGVAG